MPKPKTLRWSPSSLTDFNFKGELEGFESYFSQILSKKIRPVSPKLEVFWEGLEYSLFGGGKRFRPLLALLTAKALGKNQDLVFPFAASVEMIHTYSLIHDDLPSLDNDDERRGRPTHHKKFGEDMALLAGDALQTLAFYVLAEAYSSHPKSVQVIKDLALASGVQGMVGGQVLDMLADKKEPTAEELQQIHQLKTGALISVSVTGAGLICEAGEQEMSALRIFGEQLGLAFQIADDIQDAREGELTKNYVAFFGEERAVAYLKEASQKAEEALRALEHNTSGLHSLIEFNLNRVH